MAAVAQVFDWERLARLLDLEDADTLDEQTRLLQEARLELLIDIAAGETALRRNWWPSSRGHLELLQAFRHADVESIERALAVVGASLEAGS